MQIRPSQYSVLRAMAVVSTFIASSCAIDHVDEDGTTTMTADEIAIARHALVCDPSAPVHCHARVLVDEAGNPVPNATPAGLGPAQLRDAYKITSSGSSSTIIAIVDAFGYPNAESDLGTYR